MIDEPSLRRRKSIEVLLAPHSPPMACALLFKTVEIPEMSTRRVHATIVRKRAAKAVVETALVLALLVPWALILGWLFGRDIFR
jgi:hypothetical protein